ncbi:hypothetical protein AN9330.2 [Aspergillus nidulans FGSC A4]|uniref:Alpha/beta hydrolase fold-3 domain-containing protein n=1 Tax=Emericella nidulans (strain FGSC A4 / ATCC 38163 / CBS 112.46 / NRRL 194 / M139) TaxID=227321 RepID=Q5AQV0_EMENI|nr:hypothetical protein [Aspergillus nidulans FGSC A4]EAA66397.1 hypothetical protein AN9330.2 [Aspergillus nidulans FGSC A4]CBF87415.1 TPA: conserved hypothetical protein [Aspergillus nidulans FGSC A4]|eukprot:XP_682599.1 hypothetical protein AN9330.2 [Aspergillus nidulans FGSC A4]
MSSHPSTIRPPLDPELAVAQKSFPRTPLRESLSARRKAAILTWESISGGREALISHSEVDIPGPAGTLRTSVLRSTKAEHQAQPASKTVGIVHFHGGGHVTADRFVGLNTLFDIIEKLGAVVVSAEYRLAPEHPQPAQVEDSYAALRWAHSHASELGFNPDKLVTCGGSAGGNLTAGVSLLARDRAGPKLLGQMLFYPWVDDATTSHSIEQFGDVAPWTKDDNAYGLDLALGKNREYASIYSLPARAAETQQGLSGLPPTYLDVGEADVFRDQDMEFAGNLWKAGVQTELHVWPGAWHAFDTFAPEASVSKRAFKARLEWLEKLLEATDAGISA